MRTASVLRVFSVRFAFAYTYVCVRRKRNGNFSLSATVRVCVVFGKHFLHSSSQLDLESSDGMKVD